jgi:CHASE1-domain containing sensor protein
MTWLAISVLVVLMLKVARDHHVYEAQLRAERVRFEAYIDAQPWLRDEL